jgi:uncharacterized membrane protein (UPF0127 family)
MSAPESPRGTRHFLATLLDRGTTAMVLAVKDRPAAPIATTIETAFDPASRRRGLLGRAALSPGTALILAPCSAIHSFSMRFPIDVVFTARDGRVVKIRHTMAPSRLTMAAGEFAAIEMAAGEAGRHGLRVGDVLTIQPSPAQRPPA